MDANINDNILQFLGGERLCGTHLNLSISFRFFLDIVKKKERQLNAEHRNAMVHRVNE